MDQIIAIDGPSGSGKSTIAKQVAKELNVLYVDTGSMYRAIAYYFHKVGWAYEETSDLEQKLNLLNFCYGKNSKTLIEIENEDLTETIRQHFVSELASKVSQLPTVRKFLVEKQRELVESKICVMEGRDIGTVVFPDVFIKLFLTASPTVRAKRRLEQLQQAGPCDMSLEEVEKDVIARDKTDSERAVAPLKQASDAIKVDSSNMKLEQVVNEIVNLIKSRAKEVGIAL